MTSETHNGQDTVTVFPDAGLPERYAAASGDHNPIHVDADFARGIGLPSNILHGLYVMGILAQASAETVPEDPLALRSLTVQFRDLALPEETITISRQHASPATDRHGNRLRVRLEARQGERRIARHGRAELDY